MNEDKWYHEWCASLTKENSVCRVLLNSCENVAKNCYFLFQMSMYELNLKKIGLYTLFFKDF